MSRAAMREAGTEVVGTTALDTVEGLLALVEGDLRTTSRPPTSPTTCAA
jgi:hypothetical protein